MSFRNGKTVKVSPKDTLLKNYQSQLIISVWPIYLVTKLVGLLPIQVIRKNNEIVVSSNWIDYCYFLTYMIIYGSCSIYMLNVIKGDTQYKILSPLLILIMTILMLLQMFVTIISSFIYRLNIAAFFRKISNIDKTLHLTMNVTINYRTIKGQSFKIIGMLCISSIIRTVATTLTIEIDFIEKFGLFVAALIKSLTKYTFSLLASIICKRFKRINVKLESYVNNNTIANGLLSRDLDILCKLHYKLCNIARILDRTFSLQILVSLGITLADILFHSYYLYSTLNGYHYVNNPMMVICPILWLIDETVELYDLINHCNETCVQANSTPIILHDIANGIFNIKIEKEIESLSIQMLHQKIKFSALGFFSIDYTVIYGVIGSVASYLIIFIQFDQSNNNNNKNNIARIESSNNMTININDTKI